MTVLNWEMELAKSTASRRSTPIESTQRTHLFSPNQCCCCREVFTASIHALRNSAVAGGIDQQHIHVIRNHTIRRAALRKAAVSATRMNSRRAILMIVEQRRLH